VSVMPGTDGMAALRAGADAIELAGVAP